MPFDGLAIGGLAVGETQDERYEFTGLVTDLLPDNLPRYLMGVGTPLDILEAVHRGVDMFDCIMPSQLAHRGVAFSSHGMIHFRRQVYKLSEEPLDRRCPCHVCRTYSRAYLHHLVKAGEPLAASLLTHHNIFFYNKLMSDIRENILAGTFWSFYETMKTELDRKDELNPPPNPRAKNQQRTRPARLGDYEIVELENGASSIRQISSGEVFISAGLPEKDAVKIYIDQSRLSQRALNFSEEPLIIWDIWLGAATNLMAAITCYEELLCHYGKLRPLIIYTFERDLDPLRLACKDPKRFPHLRHSAPHKLLEREEWHHPSGRIAVQLLEGDFLPSISRAAPPHLIFYDPFSPDFEADLWQSSAFTAIKRVCGGNQTDLICPTSTLEARLAMLSAGFFVGRGISTGTTGETTVAWLSKNPSTSHFWQRQVFGKEWLKAFCQNQLPFLNGLSEDERIELCRQLRQHPQFSQE
jgi:queuine tRNA-ribosyltransferase